MIPRIVLKDYVKSRKSVVLKVTLPFAVVLGSSIMGYQAVALAMMIIFSVMTGSAMNIVKLKVSGIYDRLVIAPISKRKMFLKFLGVYTLLYCIQFSPAIAVVAVSNGAAVIFSVLSIGTVAVAGTLVGMYSQSLGEVHLNSTLCIFPLLFLAVTNYKIAYAFPFIYVRLSTFDAGSFLFSLITLAALYSLLLAKASRL